MADIFAIVQETPIKGVTSPITVRASIRRSTTIIGVPETTRIQGVVQAATPIKAKYGASRLEASMKHTSVSVIDDYTIVEPISTVYVDATTGNVEIATSSIVGNVDIRRTIKKIDSSANTVTVLGTIDGDTNYVLTTENEAIEIQSNGSEFSIVSNTSSGSGGSGTPASTVTDETSFGVVPAVGTDTKYARQDHTHGTPENPLPGHLLAYDHTAFLTYTGYIFVTGVTGAGNVTESYLAGTVPANAVVESANTDNDSVTISIQCEGGVNWSPAVTIDGQSVTLSQNGSDHRVFTGSKTITVSESRTVPIVSSTGATTSVDIVRAGAGPAILTAVIGSYPGSQTATKQGDTLSITGTQESEATHIKLDGTDAFSSLSGQDGNGWVAVSGTTFNITGVVSNNSGSQSVSLIAKNSLGTEGASHTSSNSITLDQASPVIGSRVVGYPVGQSAFKGTEAGTVTTTVTDFSSIVYSSPHGDFTPSNATMYEAVKTITCTNPGDYNDSSTNFRIVATKASNGTSTTANTTIEVADVAPIVTVTQPQTRLRSGGNDGTSAQNYTITATSNQNLAGAPGIATGVGGTWQDAGFTGSGKVWTRTLQIHDDDTKGTGDWSFSSIPTNNAGTNASIVGTQNNGGFVTRDISLDAFANEADMNVDATTYSLVSLQWLDQDAGYAEIKDVSTQATLNTVAPVVGQWCLTQISPQPNTIRILDTEATNARSTASTIRIQESVS